MQTEYDKLVKEVFIIYDYRGQFYFSSSKNGASLNINKLTKALGNYFSRVTTISFSEIRDFSIFNGAYILYHTSEDPGLNYKDYIEDVVLAIEKAGGILIPNFYLFRAHHNKIFGDFYVRTSGIESIKSYSYGTFEEYYKDFKRNIFSDGTYVFKTPFSTKSSGVIKIDSHFSKIVIPFYYSMTFRFDNIRRKFKNFIYKTGYTRQSNNRKKFIIQEFKYSPDGDYRVIIYGDHYYVLHRKNRKNDFRASGSGIFSFDTSLPDGLLNYSKSVFSKFNCPYIALDVGISDKKFVLYEYQAISMGQFAAENAPHYFCHEFDQWRLTEKNISIEEEISRSVILFLKNCKK